MNHTPGALRAAERIGRFAGVSPEAFNVIAAMIDAETACKELADTLRGIANANPSKWDEDMRDQFQPWAQSRANHALAKAEGRA